MLVGGSCKKWEIKIDSQKKSKRISSIDYETANVNCLRQRIVWFSKTSDWSFVTFKQKSRYWKQDGYFNKE